MTTVTYAVTLDVDEADKLDRTALSLALYAAIRERYDAVGLTKPDEDAMVNSFTVAPSKQAELTEALHNIILSSNANCGDSLANAINDAVNLVGLPEDEDDGPVYTTREDAVRAIESLLGSGGSYALASRVYDYMREQGIVTHNGKGFVIERDANVFQIAADLLEDGGDSSDDDPMGATYCDRCNNQLESGQIGLCDDCQDSANDCADGMHSWVNETGKLPPDTRCTRCGALYGNPD